MSDTCLNCKFSRGQSEALECRRNPPIGDERFPLVRDDQWCGEFLISELAAVRTDRPADVVKIPPEKLTRPNGESPIADKPVYNKKPHAKTARRRKEK